jgi:geranylgeranyl diphosphate synthase type II
VEYFDGLVCRAIEAIPHCAGEAMLKKLVAYESERLVPNALFERENLQLKSFTQSALPSSSKNTKRVAI